MVLLDLVTVSLVPGPAPLKLGQLPIPFAVVKVGRSFVHRRSPLM